MLPTIEDFVISKIIEALHDGFDITDRIYLTFYLNRENFKSCYFDEMSTLSSFRLKSLENAYKIVSIQVVFNNNKNDVEKMFITHNFQHIDTIKELPTIYFTTLNEFIAKINKFDTSLLNILTRHKNIIECHVPQKMVSTTDQFYNFNYLLLKKFSRLKDLVNTHITLDGDFGRLCFLKINTRTHTYCVDLALFEHVKEETNDINKNIVNTQN